MFDVCFASIYSHTLLLNLSHLYYLSLTSKVSFKSKAHLISLIPYFYTYEGYYYTFQVPRQGPFSLVQPATLEPHTVYQTATNENSVQSLKTLFAITTPSPESLNPVQVWKTVKPWFVQLNALPLAIMQVSYTYPLLFISDGVLKYCSRALTPDSMSA
jgi:hypothetical protein